MLRVGGCARVAACQPYLPASAKPREKHTPGKAPARVILWLQPPRQRALARVLILSLPFTSSPLLHPATMSSPTLPPTLPPIDPDTLLLSPPRSKPTATAASSPFYALFTPRRALSNISSSSRNSRGRTHLPSPGSSPSFRAGKRPFRSSSPVPDIDELALRKRARRVENVQPEPEPELLFPEPRARSKNTTNKRVLMRSLGLFSGGFLGNHCTGLSLDHTRKVAEADA